MADMHEEGDETQEAEFQNSSGENSSGSHQEAGQPVKELPSEVEVLQGQVADLNDRFLRLAADFENYRKRTERDLDNRIRFAIEKFAVELIEVIDNFDRALASEESGAREGLEQISKLFKTILEEHGITPIESVGRKFDPAEHEAVVCVPSEKEEGTVIDEVCKGYRMHDKIIRCAKVTVSKGQE